jgi:hypothetical protein
MRRYGDTEQVEGEREKPGWRLGETAEPQGAQRNRRDFLPHLNNKILTNLLPIVKKFKIAYN